RQVVGLGSQDDHFQPNEFRQTGIAQPAGEAIEQPTAAAFPVFGGLSHASLYTLLCRIRLIVVGLTPRRLAASDWLVGGFCLRSRTCLLVSFASGAVSPRTCRHAGLKPGTLTCFHITPCRTRFTVATVT